MRQTKPADFAMFNLIKRLAGKIRFYLNGPVLDSVGRLGSSFDASNQLLLQFEYRRLAREGVGALPFRDVGFKINSQSDEDGILLYLFSLIGTTNKLCVEICAGDGIECNSANLILNHGWHGLLVDGDAGLVARGTEYYRRSPHTYVFPPRLVCSWVTRENVNTLLKDNGFEGEIDLLSIDLDGVDYWIWRAIEVVKPRVVVVEYQDILGPERAWTVPYSECFASSAASANGRLPQFFGASLPAFVKLAHQKGYRLVGVNRYGYNAFFVRNGLADDLIPAVEVKDCFSHPKVIEGIRERSAQVMDLPWEQV